MGVFDCELINTICPLVPLLRLLVPELPIRPAAVAEAAMICCFDICRPIELIERLLFAFALPVTVDRPRVAWLAA